MARTRAVVTAAVAVAAVALGLLATPALQTTSASTRGQDRGSAAESLAERATVIAALDQLLAALGVQPEELLAASSSSTRAAPGRLDGDPGAARGSGTAGPYASRAPSPRAGPRSSASAAAPPQGAAPSPGVPGAPAPPGDVAVADRDAVVATLRQLLDQLGIKAEELVAARGCDPGSAAAPGKNPIPLSAAPGRNPGPGSAATPGRNPDPGSAATPGRNPVPPAVPPGGAAACPPSPASANADETITIANSAFGPERTVQAGATVRVVNLDTARHGVAADDRSFATPTLATGESATFTVPMAPGRHTFRSTIDPRMTGALLVAAPTPGQPPVRPTAETAEPRYAQ